MPKFGYLGSELKKKKIFGFKISTFDLRYRQNFVKKLKVNISWPKIPKFGHLGWKSEKRKIVESSRFPQLWNFASYPVVLQLFFIFLAGVGSFRLVSARFSWFRVLVYTTFRNVKCWPYNVYQRHKPFSDQECIKNILLIDSKRYYMLPRHWYENKTLNLKHSDTEPVVFETKNTASERHNNATKEKLGSNRRKLQKYWW